MKINSEAIFIYNMGSICNSCQADKDFEVVSPKGVYVPDSLHPLRFPDSRQYTDSEDSFAVWCLPEASNEKSLWDSDNVIDSARLTSDQSPESKLHFSYFN